MPDRSAERVARQRVEGRPSLRSWLPTPVPLIGRKEELAAFQGVVEDLAAGRGRSVWIEGEPGIGKTAFLAQVIDRIDIPDCQVFGAGNTEMGGFFPLRALLDAFRIHPTATDPHLAEIVDTLWGRGSDDLRQGNAVAAAGEMLLVLVDRLCAAGPVVVVIDDLQWSDDATVAVWSRLDEATQQMPLLLVAAARPVPRRDVIDRLRRRMTAGGGVTVQLGPLNDDEVGQFVRQVVMASPGTRLLQLLRQAAGNPLYVRELADALIKGSRIRLIDGLVELADGDTSAPKSLAAATTARLSFLTDSTVRVLRMAAVLGQEFGLEQLSLLAGQPPMALAEAIDEATSAGVLTDAGTVFAFRHGLIHRALHESTPAATRHALNRQAARALAAAGDRAENVITHLQAAPGPIGDWALDWLIQALPSLTTRAPRASVELLRRVRDDLNAGDPRRVAFEAHLGDALFSLGDYAEFHRVAVPVLVEASDPKVVGRLTWFRAIALASEGRHQEGMELGESSAADRRLTPSWRARMLAMRAVHLVALARLDESLVVARQAETAGEEVADRVAIGWALFARARATGIATEDSAAVLALAERGLAVIGDDLAAAEIQLLLRGLQLTALWNLSRPEEVARAMGKALALAERAGSPVRLASLRVHAAEINFLAGRWDDALPELDAAAVNLVAPRSPNRWMLAGVGALIAVHRADDALLERYLAVAVELDVDVAGFSDNLRVARALVEERSGRPDAALAMLLELLDADSSRTFAALDPHRCVLIPTVVRLALDLGRRDVADAGVRACLAEAAQRQDLSKSAAASHCRGLISADAEHLMAAACGYERAGRIHSRGVALEDATVALASKGDLAAARQALSGAIDVYSSLDAHWDIRRAQARARRLGVRRSRGGGRRRPATGWHALTRTEVTVAKLVAAGRSNPEIAGELYLSRSTVQSHVSHILAKLGCGSRWEIASFASDSG